MRLCRYCCFFRAAAPIAVAETRIPTMKPNSVILVVATKTNPLTNEGGGESGSAKTLATTTSSTVGSAMSPLASAHKAQRPHTYLEAATAPVVAHIPLTPTTPVAAVAETPAHGTIAFIGARRALNPASTRTPASAATLPLSAPPRHRGTTAAVLAARRETAALAGLSREQTYEVFAAPGKDEWEIYRVQQEGRFAGTADTLTLAKMSLPR